MKHSQDAIFQWVEDGNPIPGPRPHQHDWGTAEGRLEAIWSRIRGAGDTNARRMELLFCRAAPILPIITCEEFETLWERCQS